MPGEGGKRQGKAEVLAGHGKPVAVHLLYIRGVLPHAFVGLLYGESCS